jgi:hypothetical protein
MASVGRSEIVEGQLEVEREYRVPMGAQFQPAI